MKKIVIVVSGGRVDSVFTDEKVEVEVVDFDDTITEEEQQKLRDYIIACSQTMKEFWI